MTEIFSWRRDITSSQWRTLFASHLGWLLDGFDVMLFAFALVKIKDEFHLSSGEAGALVSVTLIASAVGGIAAGYFSDKWGRAKVLIGSILFYSLFTGFTATASSITMLIVWRSLVGLGLGAEWSAGSVLIAESWPDRHRGKAVGFMQAGWALGYIAAGILSSLVLPRFGWRPLFVLGIFPALITFWIRRNVPESEKWSRGSPSFSNIWGHLFSKEIRGKIFFATALATSLLFAYWGLFTWLPTYLSSSSAVGGAGLSSLKSLEWIISVQIGAFAGYVSFGFLSDRFGRKSSFLIFVLISALIVPLYGLSSEKPLVLFILGPALGFFGHGYFSLFGAYLAELFETSIRGTAQGFCYNVGRAVSATAPLTIGFFADRYGFGVALASTSAFYILSAFLILFLPETKGESLQ